MIKGPEHLSQELGRLRQAFLERLPERVQAIETTLNDALSAEEVDRQRVDALFNLAHRLCGSAGIYGYPTVHEAAGAIERVAEGFRDAGLTDEPRRLIELRQLVEALKRASRDAAAGSAGAK